jgi:hypothetical protein
VSDGPITPMLVLGGISYANNWVNTGNPLDVKPLLFAGVAALLLEGFAAVPGAAPVATAIGWLTVTGYFLGAQNVVKGGVVPNSPVANLLKIVPTQKGK